MDSNEKTMTMDDLKKSGLKIQDSKKVNMRYRCLQMIDQIVDLMYSPGALKLMQRQGFSVEPDDISEAKKDTKKKKFDRYVQGKTTKQLTGAISELQKEIDLFDF